MLNENILNQFAKQVAHQAMPIKGTILTIDDRPRNLSILKEAFSKANYKCIQANSADRAEDLCVVEPDGIVADCILRPGGEEVESENNGVMAVKRIGEHIEKGLEPPVLMYTSQPKTIMESFQVKAREEQLKINKWLCVEDYEGYEQLVEELIKSFDNYVYESKLTACTKSIFKQLGDLLQPIKADIDFYSQVIGDISKLKCLHSYKGEVSDYRPSEENKDENGEGSVQFEAKGNKFRWTFPGDKLRAAGAVFIGAKVQWDIYVAGSTTISTLRYIGPNMRNIHGQPSLYKISSKELKELDI